ncbi:hypothetical protein XA68_10237 [Ophiocordyceps unilateralis]|uniref:Uncharacterized protein n=1 Tax=Ophiocordyceps unilateralis TaxID=268505 RepID=A0A2A9P2Y0_OPHUN|nr:hypothetical protein XA68_10237 [Ophiocordyceps unilateralis]
MSLLSNYDALAQHRCSAAPLQRISVPASFEAQAQSQQTGGGGLCRLAIGKQTCIAPCLQRPPELGPRLGRGRSTWRSARVLATQAAGQLLCPVAVLSPQGRRAGAAAEGGAFRGQRAP